MPSFAIIAEGVTDQAVLENILLGHFGDEEEEPVVTYVQPPRDTKAAPGGWTLVLRSLKQGDHRKALQLNDYVVVHLDTDVCEEPGYDVPRRAEGGRELAPEELVQRVALRLRTEMGSAFCDQYGGRILFAIAVDSIECWLLPLLYENEPAKKAKTAGCPVAADRKLLLLKRPPLSKTGSKSLASYEAASREYRKRHALMAHRGENPSLGVFVRSLEALSAGVPPETGSAEGAPPGTTGEPLGHS